MNRGLHDLRLATRSLYRSPRFSLVAILILGLGIGVSAAMWTVLQSIIVRPLPVRQENRIVLPRIIDAAGADLALGLNEVDQLQHASRTMAEIAGFAHAGANEEPLLDGDRQLHLKGSQVFGNVFEVLGARPALGRLLVSKDDSTSHVMVLSYRSWQQDFGGDPSVLGHRVRQTWLKVPYTIVGVAQPGLDFPVGSDYWVPLPFPQLENVVARLVPGATPEMARQEFLVLMRRLRPQSGPAADIQTAVVQALPDAVVGTVRPALEMIAAAVGLLLLITCVNLGVLSILRAGARAHELTIRRALGATSGALGRQLVAESAVLGVVGAALGLVGAEVVRRALVALAPAGLPRLDELRRAGLPYGAVAVLSVLAVFVFGLIPTAAGLRGRLAPSLRSSSRQTGTRDRRTLRQALVATEVALALMMVTGAALLVRSLGRLDSIRLGYEPSHLTIISLSLPVANITDQQSANAMYDAVAQRLAAVPGVASVTPTLIPPLMGPSFWSFAWQADWQTAGEAEHSPRIPIEVAGEGFFHTFDIPIVRGRGILASDRDSTPLVAVVSQSVADRLWPGKDPIGRRLQFVGDTNQWRTVVGIAGEAHLRSLRTSTPTVYLPWKQSFWQGMIAIRTSVDLSSLLPSIRHAINTADPGVTMWSATPMDEYLAVPLATPRIDALLVSAFGLAALFLAALGLYGVLAAAVGEQTREIGVRMALGATPLRLRREVVGGALRVVAAGAAVGLAGALVLTRFARSLLFDISPADPVALSGACLALMAIALLAAYIPALQASRVDPARALQSDV